MTLRSPLALAVIVSLATPFVTLPPAWAADRTIERTGPNGASVSRSLSVEPGAGGRTVTRTGPQGRTVERSRACVAGSGCTRARTGPGGSVSVSREPGLRPAPVRLAPAPRGAVVVRPVRPAVPRAVVIAPRTVVAPPVVVRPAPVVRRPLVRGAVRAVRRAARP